MSSNDRILLYKSFFIVISYETAGYNRLSHGEFVSFSAMLQWKDSWFGDFSSGPATFQPDLWMLLLTSSSLWRSGSVTIGVIAEFDRLAPSHP